MPQLPLSAGAAMPSEFRVSPPSPQLSSLSPLAAPFTAGARPIASDHIHNPASLGPTAPAMAQSDQRGATADAFSFAGGGADGGVGPGGVSYYQTYEQWKTSWPPSNAAADGSGSWIDPSHNYPFPAMDNKVSAAPMDVKHYPQSQSDQRWPHTHSMMNTFRNVQEPSPWKHVHDASFYSKGSFLSNDARSSGISPTPTEPFLDLFPNPSRSSVHVDPFSTGFRSSVVGPMLKDLSDSFSLDAGSSKGYRGLQYDKYTNPLESPSAQSTDPPLYGPGSFVPTERLVKNTSGYAASFENPCRINLEYLDLPHEQKDPVTHSTTNRAKVTIAAPISKLPASKGDNQVKGPRELQVKCSQGNTILSNPCTGFDLNSSLLESLDEHNVVLDSPCWKGVPSSSQYTFSQRHTDASNFPLESENSSGSLLPSDSDHDRKLDSVTIGLVNPSEEKTKDEKTNKKFKAENLQENVSSDNIMKDEKGKRVASTILPDIGRPQTDVMLLIKSMHDQSQVLLTSRGDDIEIKENELKLLQVAIENLQSFAERRNKLKANNDGPASSSTIAEETGAGMDNKACSNEANNNQTNVGLHHADTTYKKSVLEALDKIPEEDPQVQAELYKNLWIEAEASLCTMKYELQLARTKLKMMSQKHAAEVNSSCSSLDAKLFTSVQPVYVTAQPKQNLGDLDYDMSKESEPEVPVEAPVGDSVVMARFRILKSRTDNAASQNPTEVQDHINAEKSVEENITVENKEFSSLASSGDKVHHDEANSDVMARLRILKRRGDVGLNMESVFPNFYSLGFAMDHDLQPQAGSSEWEHVLRDELSPPGNNPMNG